MLRHLVAVGLRSSLHPHRRTGSSNRTSLMSPIKFELPRQREREVRTSFPKMLTPRKRQHLARRKSTACSTKSVLSKLVSPTLANPGEANDTAFYFKKYVPADQENLVQKLIDNLLTSQESNADLNGETSQDKKIVRGAVFYGMSGSGKTRLAVELMKVMRQLLDKVQQPNAMQRALKAHLSNPRIVYINCSRNGLRYNEKKEKEWSEELVIGARLAAKFWFPTVNFKLIRKKINKLSPQEREALEYESVLQEIESENNAKNEQDRFTALHIILDEFQVMAAMNVPYKGTKVPTRPTETLSCAIARVLTEHHPDLFTFVSFVGIGFRSQDIFSDLSVTQYPSFCLRRLSIQSSKQIIEQEIGTKWLTCPDLDKVLATMGGNARLLEVLVQSVLTPMEEPGQFNAVQAISMLRGAAQDRFNRAFLAEPIFVWPMLLSLAGYNLKQYAVVAKDTSGNKITADELAQKSYVSVRGPNSDERWPGADNTLVMDTPIILARWALDNNFTELSAFIPYRVPQLDQITALRREALNMTQKVYHNAGAFEELVARHFVFRWNMLNFSLPSSVPASELFNGGYCSEKFRNRQFALEDEVLQLAEASVLGVWAEGTGDKPNLKDEVVLSSHNRVKFYNRDPQFRGLLFGGKNVFDAHLRLSDNTGRGVIIWIDAKHTAARDSVGYLSDAEVKELKKKLESLQNAPALVNYIHLLVVISNRIYAAPREELGDDICIIARDGLTFGTSPWISLLSQSLSPQDKVQQ